MKIDFHVHTKYSRDSYMEPEKLVKAARRKGLDGVAVTDHNSLEGALKTARFGSKDFKVIPGQEIKTEFGEITGLFLNTEIKSRNFHEVVDGIKSQGGLVVVPHPFDILRRSTLKLEKVDLRLIDVVEGFNSRVIFNAFNKKAMELAKEKKKPVIAGSDAHLYFEVGNAFTSVDEDIKRNIKAGRTAITGRSSIFLVHGFTTAYKLLRKTFRS